VIAFTMHAPNANAVRGVHAHNGTDLPHPEQERQADVRPGASPFLEAQNTKLY
jgi:hypothetical protein